MNLQQMRDFVRLQLDLDETDLPDVLLDTFLQQGYDMAVGLENRWPFFETSWAFTTDELGHISLGTDVGHIETVLAASDGHMLQAADPRWLYAVLGPAPLAATPAYWSIIGRQLSVIPPSGTAYGVTAYGYRMGADWIAVGASAEADCDRRLHVPICWYACSLGYAQQEDEVLEATYLNRFRESVMQARDAIMRPWVTQPLQFAWTHYPASRGAPGGPTQLIFQLPAAP